ncbi:MAG: UDP-N-acetylmuramoyl-L-alanyl-D-glutamate--2,6-diaminopimelate ligase [Pseudomonadota bacterium]|nr:UDP-N-acetylmuramoyl-L-alanyl-D-glutamate--2,6-diaminopimelate ligase [Pseudomonadota bacterium]
MSLLSSIEAATWLTARVSGTLRTDSRRVLPGDGFVAWPGHQVDARRFVRSALDAGATACLVEADAAGKPQPDDERVAAVTGLKSAIGAIASSFYGHPSRRLQVVAVTGTNGKTSTAWWTAQALAALGQRCGLMGTLGVGEPGSLRDAGLTTPDAVTVQQNLARFAKAGFRACVLEASSIGLAEGRLTGTAIEVALFSNLSRDHLDFHGSMDAYRDAKRALFDWPGLRAAVLNIDDPVGAAFAESLALAYRTDQPEGALRLITVSTEQPATLRAEGLQLLQGGLAFTVVEGDDRVAISTRMVGTYNVYNLLLVLGALRALGVPLTDATGAVAALTPVPGRLHRVDTGIGNDLLVYVDYAHTPDALDKALTALRPLATARQGRLWCVFGCGGNRDATKRPLMGAVAAARADRVVLTSDNPRDEVPASILAQILVGVTGHDEVDVIEDRQTAIRGAIRDARSGDVLLLAGKGHETTQEIAGIERPFSDITEAESALALRGARS